MTILKNALVFGSGYLLGSRAGQERYRQLEQRGRALLQRWRGRRAPQVAPDTSIDDLTEAELDVLTTPDDTTGGAPPAQ